MALDTLYVTPMDRNIEYGGEKIYALNGIGEGDEVLIVDASQPDNLQLADSLTVQPVISGFFNNPILDFEAQDDFLFVGTKDGTKIYDCSDPYNPFERVNRHSGFRFQAMAWNEPYLYVGRLSEGSFPARLYALEYDPTFVLGLQKRELSEIPENFQLFQNYPNPFNPSTTIEFALPHSGNVTLKIYNILGQVVEMLVSERLAAGRYEYLWNASGMASGIYLYRFEAGSFSQTKKLILLK